MTDEPGSPDAPGFRKAAADPSQVHRIVAEAEVLEAARLPGVVELIGIEGDADRPVLVTARVDGPDLSTAHLPLAEVAGVVAAVATTLADLHDLGLVHGALTGEHVLLGGDGRPVLCGFGYAARSGCPPGAEWDGGQAVADPARRPGDPLVPSTDVYALGVLLGELSAAAAQDPGRNYLRTSTYKAAGRWPGTCAGGFGPDPQGTWSGTTRRSALHGLRAVVERATNPDPSLRLSARSLAAAVTLAVPEARLPRRKGTAADDRVAIGRADYLTGGRDTVKPGVLPTSPLHSLRIRASAQRRPRAVGLPRRVVVASGGLVLLVTALAVVRLTGGSPAPPAAPAPADAAGGPMPTAAATTAAATTASVPTPWTETTMRPGCPDVESLLVADTDGDGCPEALNWVDGEIRSGERRWVVGRPGDQVAAADWTCTGRATLALLRPDSGEVYVFDGWAEPGRDRSAAVAGRVQGGFALRAADLGGGCPRLVVERRGGPPVAVAPGPHP
jgi:hypothetical protein